MMELNEIDNVIAEDVCEYRDANGITRKSKIIVGKPFKVDESEWTCPVYIEDYTKKVVEAKGEGSVDSLMNAMTLVKSFFDNRVFNHHNLHS